MQAAHQPRRLRPGYDSELSYVIPREIEPQRKRHLRCAARCLRPAWNLRSLPYGVTFGLGSSFIAHSPELKSVNNTCPFHGIAFITNGALAVCPFGSYGLNTAISRR